MTVALWCILIAIILPYVCTGIAKASGGFRLSDNHDPRDFLESLNWLGQCPPVAQVNSVEVAPAFGQLGFTQGLVSLDSQGIGRIFAEFSGRFGDLFKSDLLNPAIEIGTSGCLTQGNHAGAGGLGGLSRRTMTGANPGERRPQPIETGPLLR